VPGISQELMCPTCKQRLDMSNAPAADQIRRYLVRAHARGETKAAVKRQLVAEYGEAVLAAPPRKGFGWAAWLVPAAAILAGALVAAWLARRWAARPRRTSEPALTGVGAAERERLERRLDADLERFE
jgi:cytochrome c-type biogenesis protein CcmH